MKKFETEVRLSREMGLMDATMIGVGAMIGAGIFVLIGIAAGRGSQFILKDFPGAFHVLIVASVEVRVKRVMESLKVNEGDARNEIARFDNGSSEFVKRYFKANIADPVNVKYDMVINTNHFNIESAASIIVDAFRLPLAK